MKLDSAVPYTWTTVRSKMCITKMIPDLKLKIN